MFPILRRHWTLWAAWTTAAAVLLFANPFGPFGWPELFACLGSLGLVVDWRIRREPLLVLGLPVIALLAAIDGQGAAVSRLVVDWIAFIGAVLLAARAVDDQCELESIAGQISLHSDPVAAFERFRLGVADEVARSRRHERSFVVLSIAPHPGTSSAAAGSQGRLALLLAHARSVLEIAEVLRDELHRYAEVVATERRVLCRVPETEAGEIDALLDRLAVAIRDVLSTEVQIGVASFPTDALGVDDLIAAADEAREKTRLARVADGDDEGLPRPGNASSSAGRLRDLRR